MYTKLLVLSLSLLTIVHLSSGFPYKEYFFKQKVDQFGNVNTDYFDQRYLMHMDHWDPDVGTIFFYTGNEGDIEMFAKNSGFMWEHAPKFHALVLFIEHRYYGKSLPYGPDGLNNAQTRGYLSSEQALADFAVLLSHLKSVIPGAQKSSVIAFGGSYGGMLAAWMRMKYPHLITGAIASSAPILQFQDLTPCAKFVEIATNDFRRSGQACVDNIRRSWGILKDIGENLEGAQWLSQVFKLCTPINPLQIDDLINWITSTWIYMATTNYPYPTDFLLPLPGHPVNKTCAHLMQTMLPDRDLMMKLYDAVSVFQNHTGQVSCYNLSEAAGKDLGGNAWDYQACTEMVMPMCQTFQNDMFEPSSWDFDKYAKMCQTVWQVQPEPNKIVQMYGGRDIKAYSNIVFSNGNLDPWMSGGVLESLSDTLIAVVIEGSAHHLDLRETNPLDPPGITKARQLHLSWIAKWSQRS